MTFITIISYVGLVTTTFGNKNLILMNHVNIGLQWNSWRKCIPPLSPYNVPTLSNEGKHDGFDGVMCGYPLTSEWTMC